jgi:PAS domain S-box-containing protein
MTSPKRPNKLRAENAALRLCLQEAEETLRAIGNGEVDAFVVSGPAGKQIFTLKGAEHPYRLLVETMNEGAATLGPDGTILYCNQSLASLLQIPQEKLIGSTFCAFVAERDRSVVTQRMQTGASGHGSDEIQLLSQAGSPVPVLLSCRPVELSGSSGTSMVLTDLTQQKQNEAIIASEGLARSIIDQAGEAIFVCDEKGEIIRASRVACQLVGENPLHKNFDALFQPGIPDQAAPFSVLPALSGQGVESLEVEYQRGSGQSRHLILNATPLCDSRSQITGCVVTLTDITERKKAEAALQKLNEELEQRVTTRTGELAATVETLQLEIAEREVAEENLSRLNRLYLVLSETNHAIVCTKDPDLFFEEICRIAVEDGGFRLAWIGLVDGSGAGVKIAASCGASGYLEDIAISESDDLLHTWPTGISVRVDTHCICNDFLGSLRTSPWQQAGAAHGIASAASIPLKQEGKVIGALTLYADTKDFFDQQQTALLQQMGADVSFALDNLNREMKRREAERDLHDQTIKRLLAVEALREKEQMLILQSRQAAMGEMISNIAHQWRQPLNTLSLSVQEAKMMHDFGECTAEFMESSTAKSMGLIQHMSQTIDDFRDYFKPDKDKATFKVAEVIASTLILVQDSFKRQGVAIEIVTEHTPEIFGYRNEYAQTLLNILNNARDALTERKIEKPRVTVTLSSEGERAVVTVADNAGGIPEDIIGKIFDPYFTTKGPQTGTGLGLFMSKNIVEKNLGGSLTVCNKGDGAEFRIEV